MKTPVFVISEEDGIPVPSSEFILDIPQNKAHLLRTRLDEVDGLQKVILAFSPQPDTWEQMSDSSRLLESLYSVGVLCSIKAQESSDEYEVVWLHAEARVIIHDFYIDKDTDPNLILTTENLYSDSFAPGEETIINQIQSLITMITQHPKRFDSKILKEMSVSNSLLEKLDAIANRLFSDNSERLEYIQALKNYERITPVLKKVESNILDSVKLPKKQKKPVISSVRNKFESVSFPPVVKSQLKRDLTKLEQLQKSSNEYSATLDYLNWAMEIPWNKYSKKDFPLASFIKELNTSHYGLPEVKNHLLEHLTIERLKEGSTGLVLCFVGEPGTGKTSIVKSIARASNRKLERIALGGLTDEADIRGHRRTYLASRPGRIITGLKRSGVMDPLFLLDEIDKISSRRGDPSAALLEVLDPEQNTHFIDRYMEFPVDISKAMFICTANYEEQIPPALLDRMELIRFRKYKREERLAIIEKFILPNAIKSYNLDNYPIAIEEEIIDFLSSIEDIRKIEKIVKKLLRMAAVQIVVNKKNKIIINKTFAASIVAKQKSSRLGFQ